MGRTNPKTGGTAGWLAEFRVWNVARSEREIRENFDRSFADVAARPVGLTQVLAGADWGTLHGRARVELSDDAPALLTAAEAAVQDEKFARFRTLANTRGNPEHGRELFTATCGACHQVGGKGGQIAPALDGVGNIGVEALLRNILTPSAAMESAYRVYRVVATDGSVREGFLAEDAADSVVLRIPGAEDRRIPRSEIRQTSYLQRSLMPEGLLESLPAEHVSDLFAHLKSLK
ncbi:MAG: c-type cytochrome [Verrucomicrobiota bacterium]